MNFVGGKGNRIDASHAFAILLEEVCKRAQSDALMWAKLEVSLGRKDFLYYSHFALTLLIKLYENRSFDMYISRIC